MRRLADADFTHVHLAQVGPAQEECLRFFERELGPALTKAGLLESSGRAAA